ncbi:MAG: hypothetical protein VW450_05265 [Chloroflexota bacterium]
MRSDAFGLLVIAPTKRELGGVHNQRARGVATGIVGVGHGAGDALAGLLARRRPTLVLSLGYAGGLAGGLATGSLVVCGNCQDDQGADLGLDPDAAARAEQALEGAGIAHETGALLTTAGPLLTPQAKGAAWEATGAACVDMEGLELARAADAAGVPIVAVRAVLDGRAQELPGMVGAIIADGGRNEWLHAARAVLSGPQRIPALVGLAGQSRAAGAALERAAAVLVARLAPEVEE